MTGTTKTTPAIVAGHLLLAATLLLVACGEGASESDSPAPAQAMASGAEGPGSDGVMGPETAGLEGADPLAGGRLSDGSDGGAVDPDRSVQHAVEDGARVAGGAGSGEAAGETSGEARGQRAVSEPQPASGRPDATDAAAPSSRQASPEAILRATSKAYEGLRSFRAEFEQTLHNTLIGRTTTSRGTVYQRQPDRFLMDFSDPSDDVIVSDGDFFWMYFPSVDRKQVLRTARGAQGLDLHAQFIGDPVRRFETTYHGTDDVRGRAAHVMTLVPRESAGYQRLKVWIDAEDHLVRRFELTEANDNVRHFALRDLVKNPALPNDLFEFTPPPGAQVVTR